MDGKKRASKGTARTEPAEGNGHQAPAGKGAFWH